ncbi:reticulon-3 isoform X2 [Rattus rattus]|uniref:reticulon-3 isoform X2 n=1 Tax=Rattus rattus TaxID=10117 RepID=UPI0013F35CFC|nr:reticulon-3 isoform X2 [Rattus rattus]
MAESSAATQSPSVSSSSSGAEPSALGGGGGSPGACPALGAKSCGSSCAVGLSSLCSDEPPSKIMTSSFLSSSEIYNPDPTTPLGSETLGSHLVAKDGKDPLVLLDKKTLDSPQGTNKDRVDTPVSLAADIPCSQPSIPDSFPEQPTFLSKETDPTEEWVVKNQEPKNPSEVPSGEDRSALDLGQRKAEHICTHSLSPSEPAVASVEKDSPESPFEVIIDKATFDREFKDLYKESTDDLGGWAAHGDRESPADLLEMNDKVFPLRNKEAGRYPSSALLGRQFSHTTAALEEVSRCVNDMHNFTNEILTWDLDPQAKQQADKSPCTTESTGLDRSEHRSEIPVISLKTSPQQKMPVCSFNGSTPITRSTGDWTETFTEGKPVKGYLSSTKEAGGKGVPDSSQPISGSGAATVEVTLPDLRGTWPNSVLGEVTEVDSSGESDDTVIEDTTENPSVKNNKVLPEKSDSLPSAAAKTSERENKETTSHETVRSEIYENSEKQQAHAETPTQRSLEGEMSSQVPNMLNEVIPENLAMTDTTKVCSAAPPSVLSETGFSLTVPASAKSESLLGKNVEDTDGSSPEDLMAALTGTEEKGTVDKEKGDVLEAVLEKIANVKNTLPVELLHENKLSSSETKNTKSKYSEHSRETNGGAPKVSPDLEQEQLTIRAIKELGAKQVQAEGMSPGGKLKPAFDPQSGPQNSSDILEHTDIKTGSDLGIPKKPTIIKDTRIDSISSLTKTETVNKHVLARLLSDFPVHDLIFWRDVKKTGFVFGTTLIMLLSLAAFSVISVVSYLILALLSVTISFRVYKSVIQAVQKSEEGHPFKAYLDVDITLSSEAFHSYMNAAMVHVNKALKLIIRLFLVEDLVDSLKLAVFMWLMTYVGAVFNGITLLILAELLVFSVPIVYEKYKTQIDHYVGIARDQTKSIVEKIQAKLPGIAKKKAE